jgi:hypothetical protein
VRDLEHRPGARAARHRDRRARQRRGARDVLAVDRDQPAAQPLEHDEHGRIDAPADDAEQRREAQHRDGLAAEPHDADDVRRRQRDRRHRGERDRGAQVLERDRVDVLADREHGRGQPLVLGRELGPIARELGGPRPEQPRLGLARRRLGAARDDLHGRPPRPARRARNVRALVV